MTTPIISEPPHLEIAQLFSQFREDFLLKYPQPYENYSFIHFIESCRTEKMGGHVQKCSACDYSKPMYNSCRSRMCPKCQSLKRERWVEARTHEILPCKYFHGVFTLPHSINYLAISNKKLIFSILFESVSGTLQAFAKEEMGGKLGFISVLHTWNQLLLDHIHLHCLIPAGVIHSETGQWKPCRSSTFLFPVLAVSKIFRSKFLVKLKAIHSELKLEGDMGYLKNPASFQDFIDSAWKEAFLVYTKQPFNGAQQVLDYLGRYVHRTGMSNHRLVSLNGDRITFKYRDRKDENKEKLETVPVVEFLRRFMLHTLPKGFPRIRYHGFLANRSKEKNVTQIYRDLAIDRLIKLLIPITAGEFLLKRFGIDINRCPQCKDGTLYGTGPIPKARSP
jgi:hypothetical protein